MLIARLTMKNGKNVTFTNVTKHKVQEGMIGIEYGTDIAYIPIIEIVMCVFEKDDDVTKNDS